MHNCEKRKGLRPGQLGCYAALFILALLMLYPMIFMLITSVKSNPEYYSNFWGLAKEWHFEYYLQAWSYLKSSYVNSIMICLIGVPMLLVLGSVSAYAFARLRFPFKNPLYYMILIMMMIPSMLTLISSYMLTANLGILNTYGAVSFMNIANGLPFVVLVMRNFFAGLPEELFEAARMDGAHESRIFFQMALPLSKPILVTVFVMRLLNDWNDYMWPALTLSEPKLWPVSVSIKAYKASFDLLPQYGPLYAGFTIVVIPLLIFFFLSMRHFMEGMTAGAIKG